MDRTRPSHSPSPSVCFSESTVWPLGTGRVRNLQPCLGATGACRSGFDCRTTSREQYRRDPLNGRSDFQSSLAPRALGAAMTTDLGPKCGEVRRSRGVRVRVRSRRWK